MACEIIPEYNLGSFSSPNPSNWGLIEKTQPLRGLQPCRGAFLWSFCPCWMCFFCHQKLATFFCWVFLSLSKEWLKNTPWFWWPKTVEFIHQFDSPRARSCVAFWMAWGTPLPVAPWAPCCCCLTSKEDRNPLQKNQNFTWEKTYFTTWTRKNPGCLKTGSLSWCIIIPT